jgi:hypothetical protein
LEAKNPEEIVRRLTEVTGELTGAFGAMLDRVHSHVLDALDHTDRPLEELTLRATTVRGITGNLILDNFCAKIESMSEGSAVVEGLISLAVSKPAAQWVDRDIDAAITALAKIAVDFRQAETMAPLRNRPSTRRVLGVVFGASHGQDKSGYVDIAEKDIPAIDRMVKAFLADTVGERPEVILAALAEAGAMTLSKLEKGKKNG